MLVDALDLASELRERAPELAWRTLSWIVRKQAQRADHLHAAVSQVKNTAYARRRALFLFSFCEPTVQMSQAERLRTEVRGTRLEPAAEGLLQVLDGHRFTPVGTMRRGEGRRFLGWAQGRNSFLVYASGNVGDNEETPPHHPLIGMVGRSSSACLFWGW